MEKSQAAKHSSDYRKRQAKKNEALGIERVTLNVATGVRSGMAEAMKRNGIKNAQEAWQNLGLHFMRATPKQQDKMLKPDTSGFVVSEKLAHQFHEESLKEIRHDPGDEIVAPASNS
ncbi:hypothetical protein PSCICO_47800 [Pseudomonas cichorii]|uniref:hypothetical protein n=1 Tax=Pseudomonas cichorii TaxID=36746 RepID=UPI001910411C|nr:hypothetical protein [Pseudomonas cichorii]GFM89381.1 hypothetical protein PSCICO_47800 [Pseudomonas cichorii]